MKTSDPCLPAKNHPFPLGFVFWCLPRHVPQGYVKRCVLKAEALSEHVFSSGSLDIQQCIKELIHD